MLSGLTKWLSVRLQTKWLWVRVQLQSPKMKYLGLESFHILTVFATFI